MTNKTREDVYAVLLATLRPIASMLLRLGISYRDFDRVAQAAFVAVATTEYGVKGRPANASRVSLMTGLTRKLVGRIQSAPHVAPAFDLGARSVLGEVLNVWHTDFRYCTTIGRAKPLMWSSDSPSFCDLAQQCSKSISPAAILAELVRVGAVTQSENGMLIASRRSYVPAAADQRLIQGFQYGLRPLAMTVAYNAAEKDSSKLRFQRLVWNYSLPKSQRGVVEALVSQRLKEFSQEIDDLLSEVDRSNDEKDCSVIGVGLYLVEDDPTNFSKE